MTTTPRKFFPRLALAGLIPFLGLFSLPVRAQAAEPGDVYYTAHVVQKFKYGPMSGDIVEWTNETYADTTLLQTAAHDTTTLLSVVTIDASLQANAGLFVADLNSEITASAMRGIFNQTYHDLTLDVYVRGPSGTPYDITLGITGMLHASRENGEPGTLQDVNGVSWADFEGTALTIPNGGTDSLAVAVTDTLAGVTGVQIVVNGETYSLAHTFVITSSASVTQAICILGCMTEAADFHALTSGHVVVNTYLNGLPTGVSDTPRTPAPIALTAAPNPFSGSTVVSFSAPAGTRTTIDVFDVAGGRVATLFDAPATGVVQSLSWDARGLASGVYFLRARGGALSSTRKLLLLK
jgi:hypothetical protein